jgi:DNA-binding Lrp family transcriptional regulator
MQAYILIECETGKMWDIAESTLKIEGVKMAHPVTGLFDVIVYAEFSNMDTLRYLIVEIQTIEGILRTHTAVAMTPRINSQ